LVEARAHDHGDFLAAEPACGAAAIHRGIAAAEHDHAPADRLDVLEIHRGQPVDADVDVRGGLLAARQVEVAPARRAAADEYRIVALREQRAHRIDAPAGDQVHAEVEDVAGFLVDDLLGQAEARYLGAHEAAGLRVGFVDRDLVAERREVARDGQRRRTGADARDAASVRARGALRQALADVVLEIRRDALQATDRDRLGPALAALRRVVLLDPAAPARGFARPVAGAAEDPGKHVRAPVDEVGVRIAARRDQADVLGNRGMGGTRPLAIDD